MVRTSSDMPLVAFNCMPIATGGGLQNALSLISDVARSERKGQWLIICREKSKVEQHARQLDMHVETVGNGVLNRIKFELWTAKAIMDRHGIKLCFTIFGNPPLRSGNRKTISGFAYSNILHPEVDFWQDFGPMQRGVKWLKDRLRLGLARRADCIILETPHLRDRAKAMSAFADARVEVVEMEVSNVVRDGFARSEKQVEVGARQLLVLSGAHPNKRIHLLAPIIAELRRTVPRTPYRVVTTMDERDRYFSIVRQAFESQGVAAHLDNIGPVAPDKVGELLGRVDAVVNIARLESFSNNWVEAWASGLPLISTDGDWARASCGDAALYIDPDDATSAAAAIDAMFASETDLLVANGRRRLQDLGRNGPKSRKYLALIDEFVQG